MKRWQLQINDQYMLKNYTHHMLIKLFECIYTRICSYVCSYMDT